MSTIEQIKAEIERRKSELKRYDNDDLIKFRAYDEMLSILSTLESEHLAESRKTSPKDLEEAAIQYATHKKKSEDKEMETELPMGHTILQRIPSSPERNGIRSR